MNENRENRPGRPRRCPPYPACGEDMMHGYGVKRWGRMVTRLYGCRNCQCTDTWIEPGEGGRGHWKKAPRTLPGEPGRGGGHTPAAAAVAANLPPSS